MGTACIVVAREVGTAECTFNVHGSHALIMRANGERSALMKCRGQRNVWTELDKQDWFWESSGQGVTFHRNVFKE